MSKKFAPIKVAQIKTIPTWKQRLMQAISFILILGGLLLIGIGILMPLREQLILINNPPPSLPPAESPLTLADNPLPVNDNSPLTDPTTTLTPTPTPTFTPTPTSTPTFTPSPAAEAVELELLATPITPTVTPTPTDTVTPTPTATATPTATSTPDPFPPAQSPPARIVAEVINLDSTIIEIGWHQEEVNGKTISVWDVAENAAGWHKNSALPGHIGNTVLSGHHNILGEVFRYIVDFEPGDQITLYADDIEYHYQVEEKFIVKDKGEPPEVRRANARWIDHFDDQRLTLITCWPYNNNTHRVIVVAKPILEIATK